MDFKQCLAEYVLGFLSPSDLPQVAIQAIEEGYESPSLYILAGLHKKENSFVIEQYFRKALAELSLSLPHKRQAIFWAMIYYARHIVEGHLEFSKAVSELDNLLFHFTYRWKEHEQFTEAKIVENNCIPGTHLADTCITIILPACRKSTLYIALL